MNRPFVSKKQGDWANRRGRQCPGRSGSVLVAGLIMTTVSMALLATYLNFSANDLRLTRMNIDQQRAMLLAEAGLDHGVMRLRDVVLEYQMTPGYPLQSRIDQIQPPPGSGVYQYMTPDGAPAFNIAVLTGIEHGTLPEGTYRQYDGSYQQFLVTSGVINTNNGRGVVLQQKVQAVSLSLIRFGVFYSRDLEILPGATMQFHGAVHSNGDLYLGGPLEFFQRITGAGQVFHRRKDQPHTRPGEARVATPTGTLVSMVSGGTYYDSDHPSWTTLALNRWQGQFQTREHGVSELAPPINPIDDPYALIERPVEDVNDPRYSENTEAEKFANKAGTIIAVDDAGELSVTFFGNDVTDYFTDQVQLAESGGLDAKNNGVYVMEEFGSIDTNARFYDQRDEVTNAVVDLYLDQLQPVLSTLVHTYGATGDRNPHIVYVTRTTDEEGVRPAVRLRNGQTIQAAEGLSVASDLPFYIEGDYNVNTPKPALVAGDAVTLLSRSWQDSSSDLTPINPNRVASNTEVRTVVMTGNTETLTGSYNGGLENVLRFLEHWSGRTLTYRGSIIALWYSQIADGAWSFGSYYTAPTRNWGYDPMYQNLVPPGMTRVFGMEELEWSRVQWGDVNW